MRRRGSLPTEDMSTQRAGTSRNVGTKKATEPKSKKRVRQGSSEEEESNPNSLGNITYQLGLLMMTLKQHMGPGLSRYIGEHEQELKKIYIGLKALTEMSPPLNVITQATQTDLEVTEDNVETILSGKVTDDQLINLLPKRWPDSLRDKINIVTE